MHFAKQHAKVPSVSADFCLSLSLPLPFYMKIRYNIFVRLLKNAHGPTIVNPFNRTDFKILPDNYGLYAYIYIRIIFHVFFISRKLTMLHSSNLVSF